MQRANFQTSYVSLMCAIDCYVFCDSPRAFNSSEVGVVLASCPLKSVHLKRE